MAICFVRFLFKITHAHISFWILSQLVSSFWGRHFWGFCFFCQRSWWTERQDYLWFIVSNSWWLHVWSLLSVHIVLYTPKGYYGISSIIGTSVHPRFWHMDIFVRVLPLESSWTLPGWLFFVKGEQLLNLDWKPKLLSNWHLNTVSSFCYDTAFLIQLHRCALL